MTNIIASGIILDDKLSNRVVKYILSCFIKFVNEDGVPKIRVLYENELEQKE